MSEPTLKQVQCLDARGLHRMAYWEWGDAANPRVLMCVHGMSRQGRDFDVLAHALCGEFRVICPDVAGRGRSDWLADPAAYQLPTYVADMVTLLARLDAKELFWFGTSMGGLIGMALASYAQSPIERLVLNDVGPAIRPEAVARIGAYLGLPLRWSSVDEAAAYLWTISSSFGPHTPEQWRALSRPMLKADGDGYVLHYDPNIGVAVRAATPEAITAGEALLWAGYDAIRARTLVLRGAESDLLTAETAQAMSQRGPKARVVEFAGVGHAPTLIAPEQIAVVRDFLLAS